MKALTEILVFLSNFDQKKSFSHAGKFGLPCQLPVSSDWSRTKHELHSKVGHCCNKAFKRLAEKNIWIYFIVFFGVENWIFSELKRQSTYYSYQMDKHSYRSTSTFMWLSWRLLKLGRSIIFDIEKLKI